MKIFKILTFILAYFIIIPNGEIIKFYTDNKSFYFFSTSLFFSISILLYSWEEFIELNIERSDSFYFFNENGYYLCQTWSLKFSILKYVLDSLFWICFLSFILLSCQFYSTQIVTEVENTWFMIIVLICHVHLNFSDFDHNKNSY